MRKTLYWRGLDSNVDKHVSTCDLCQRTKSQTSARLGKMMTPPVPIRPLDAVAVDFIGPLPLVSGYDYLLTCTCRLLGFVSLIQCKKRDLAEKTARRFFAAWGGIFGMPTSLLGDREKIWTSTFWQALMSRLGTTLHLMTAYHPQGDDQSKRTNLTVGQVLQTFTLKRHGRWLESLPAAEFAFNSAPNAATGFSPFELVVSLWIF